MFFLWKYIGDYFLSVVKTIELITSDELNHNFSGIVPANGEVDVVVTFTPSEFSTAVMKIQLIISQFNTKPLICTVSGSSVPGLSK